MMNDLITSRFMPSDITGETERKLTKVILCQYGDFNVNVILDSNNKFVGIESIDIEKKFYDFKTKPLVRDYYDIEKFYPSE